jgi:flagellar protein FliS
VVNQHAVSQYRQGQQAGLEGAVASASPHKLIQMLMQGCLQRVAEAKLALKSKDIAAKGLAIGKAISILDGLKGSLNLEIDNDLPQQLSALYDYMQRRLLQANLDNNEIMLDEVAALMRTVKEGWDGIEQQTVAQR